MLRTLTLAYTWVKSANRKPILYQSGEYFMQFIEYWRRKIWKVWLYEYRMVVNVSVVYPHVHAADWELQLTLAAPHHEKVSYHIPFIWGKIKIQNSQDSFYWMWIAFTHGKVEKHLSRTILSWEDHLYGEEARFLLFFEGRNAIFWRHMLFRILHEQSNRKRRGNMPQVSQYVGPSKSFAELT